MTPFRSTHDLPLKEEGSWYRERAWLHWRVGSCSGLWRPKNKSIEILSIVNEHPGNGHLTDVFEWFEHKARYEEKALVIKEFFMNPGFKKHLIKKRGFKPEGKDDVIKHFK